MRSLLYVAIVALVLYIVTLDNGEKILNAIAVVACFLYVLRTIYYYFEGETEDIRTESSRVRSSHNEDIRSRRAGSHDHECLLNLRRSAAELTVQHTQRRSSENMYTPSHLPIVEYDRATLPLTISLVSLLAVANWKMEHSVFQKVCLQFYAYVSGGSRFSSGVTVYNESLSRYFPYEPTLIGEWFQQLIIRSVGADTEGKQYFRYLDMINLDFTLSQSATYIAVLKFLTIRLEDGDKVYFHGTDVYSARNILCNGIDLTRSRLKLDFSNGYGFYVTKNYDKAIEWANRKAKYVNERFGAIIAFKICKNLRKENLHLPLKVNREEYRKTWEIIVSHFRQGEMDYILSNNLRNIKFIKGPVSKNATLYPGEIPTPHNFTQMCILDCDYAKRFGSLQNICFVIFFKKIDNTF